SVSNKNSATTNGKKTQAKLSRQEVSNSKPFDALNYVENDDELGTDGGILKAAGQGSLNVARSSCSTTPIVEKINKIEQQIHEGKFMFVDDDGKPLYKVDSIGIADSDSEVEEVFNETEGYLASTSLKSGNGSGYGTNSLLEQWRETKRDDDYDPHDVDLYESHDMSENLQAICVDFDIIVHGRNKKLINFVVY
ncbi:hypothetical protein Tco_1476577, partial [Tanacetum coccineum]